MPLIDVRQIDLDLSTQTRASLDHELVREYSEILTASESYPFPACALFEDPAGQLYIGDGFHRITAALKVGKPFVLADVLPGTQREALLHACGANAQHGARRTNEDKRRAVSLLLDDPEWSTRSNRWIADACKVSHPFVASLRPDRTPVATARDGKQYPTTTQSETLPTGNFATSSPAEDFDHIEPTNAPTPPERPIEDKTSKNAPATPAAVGAEYRLQTLRNKQLAIRSAITHTQAAATQLAALEPDGRHLRQAIDRLQENLKAAANVLYQTAPAETCPKCHAVPAATVLCRNCLGTGFINTRQIRKS